MTRHGQHGFYPGVEQIYQDRSLAAANAAFGPVTEQDFIGQWKVYDKGHQYSLRYGGEPHHFYVTDCSMAEEAIARYCTHPDYEDENVTAQPRKPDNCRAEKFGNWV